MHVVRSSSGGVEQRGVLRHAAARQPQAQRTVDKQRLQPSAQEVKAFKQLCCTAFACAADAQQALAILCTGLAGHLRGPEHRPPQPTR